MITGLIFASYVCCTVVLTLAFTTWARDEGKAPAPFWWLVGSWLMLMSWPVWTPLFLIYLGRSKP